MRICIVSPHLDDAILSCGILMQRRKPLGDEIFVLNIFTAGTNAENRRQEEQQAQEEIGARPFFLDELDAPDRNPIYKSDQMLFFGKLDPADPYIETVRRRISEFFTEHRIEGAWFPLAAGTHIDHRIAYKAGLATRDLPVRFYEDRPYILWPGVLQGRMNLIGSDAHLPRVTEQQMRGSINDYHYLKHFVPKGAYQDACLPLYLSALHHVSHKTLRSSCTAEAAATSTELEKIYAALKRYSSQMNLIYSSFDNFLHDSFAHERSRSGQSAYIERSWVLQRK